MGWPDLTYRSRLEPELRNELELLVALTQGFLSAEHGADGQHTTITVDGIQFRARDGSILATITIVGGQIVVTTPGQRGVAQGAWLKEPFDAAHFSGNGGPWTVAASDIVANTYTRIGNTLIWTLAVGPGSVMGAGSTVAHVRLPGGLVSPAPNGACAVRPGYAVIPPPEQAINLTVHAGSGTAVDIHLGGPVIPAGNVALYFTITLPVS